MKKFFRFLVLSCVIILSSCNKSDSRKGTADVDNLFKFREYIAYNSYGNNSIADPIRIELAKPLEQFDIAVQEIDSDYIKISPKTEGTLEIENSRTLVFTPSEYLKPDTEYSVTVKLKDLYGEVEKGFSNYTFSFKTITPNFKVDLADLQSYSKEWQYVNGSISSADIISLEKAKELVTVTQSNKTLKLNWEQEEGDAKYFNFTIDSIQRLVDDSEIKIAWNGKSIGADNKGENTFPIPGQNNFTVVDLKSTLSPQALLTINFSDPVRENQNFSGLVSIENANDLRFEVNGNILYVYPAARVVGTVRVTVFDGIKNDSGFGLKKEFSELVSFEQLKPAVRLISNGVILPNAASTPFYFEAVNLSAVDVRVIKVFEDNMLQYLQTANLNDHNTYDLSLIHI